MSRCDGVRITPWNSVIANEEDGTGRIYEILDPLATTNVTVLDRAAGTVSAPDKVAQRSAMPIIAWEGMEILGNGVVYGGDELRPGGASPGSPGGSIYKFIPDALYVAGTPVTALAASPLASGKSYALRVSCQATTVVYGQGCESGKAHWVRIDPLLARADAEANGATGFYRPEDMARDKTVKLPAARLCFTATGNPESADYAKVVCLTDTSVATAPERTGGGTITQTVTVQQFVLGGKSFNAFDNVDFQPVRNNSTWSRTRPTATSSPASPTGRTTTSSRWLHPLALGQRLLGGALRRPLQRDGQEGLPVDLPFGRQRSLALPVRRLPHRRHHRDQRLPLIGGTRSEPGRRLRHDLPDAVRGGEAKA